MGLATGACLAHGGHQVTCVDKDEGRVAELREGRMPIYEPGLEGLVVQNSRRGRLLFSTDFAETVYDADVLFIAVETPQGEDGSADLSSVGTVARSVGRGRVRSRGGQEARGLAPDLLKVVLDPYETLSGARGGGDRVGGVQGARPPKGLRPHGAP